MVTNKKYHFLRFLSRLRWHISHIRHISRRELKMRLLYYLQALSSNHPAIKLMVKMKICQNKSWVQKLDYKIRNLIYSSGGVFLKLE